MPEYYEEYGTDPDYLGALTMFDDQLGRLVQLLHDTGVYDNTVRHVCVRACVRACMRACVRSLLVRTTLLTERSIAWGA